MKKNIKQTLKKTTFIKLSALITIGMASFYSYGAHLSAYRIYLDQDQRDTSFIVFNKNATPQMCTLRLKHYNFDTVGNMVKVNDNEVPDNSAKPWIRYTPRSFLLTPANNQTVRFSMKRKANIEAAEYRSYITLDCEDEALTKEANSTDQPMISLKPKLSQNIPIVVRTKPLTATAELVDFKLDKRTLSFNIQRTGNRSLYGSIEVINKHTGERIAGANGLSVYTETDKLPFNIGVGNTSLADIKVIFKEDEKFGGNLIVETDAVK